MEPRHRPRRSPPQIRHEARENTFRERRVLLVMYRRRGIAGTTLDVFLRFSLTGRDTPARPTRVARISWTLEWEHLYDRSLLPVDSSPVSLLRRTASPCRGGGEAEFGRRMTDAWCNARGETGWGHAVSSCLSICPLGKRGGASQPRLRKMPFFTIGW